MSTIGIRPNPADWRRSQRILLPIAVRISGELPDGQRIETLTSTLVGLAFAFSDEAVYVPIAQR